MLRFGSLDFVATGNGFDMELLLPEANPDTLTPPTRRNRRSGQRVRQARMERRRAARLSSPTWVGADVSQPSIVANGIATSSPRAPAPSAPAPPPNAAPKPPKEGANAPSPFPFGMRTLRAKGHYCSDATVAGLWEASNSGCNLLREARTKAQESYLASVVYSMCRVDLSRYPEPGCYIGIKADSRGFTGRCGSRAQHVHGRMAGQCTGIWDVPLALNARTCTCVDWH